MRYDDESGKGDLRHVRAREVQYEFTSLEALQADFWADIASIEVQE